MSWVRLTICGVLAVAAAAGQQPSEARDLNELGLAAAAYRDHAEAERLYRASIAMWRKLGPEYQAHLAITESNLAHTLCDQGRRRECAGLFEDALPLMRRTLGAKNLTTLTTMNLLGGILLMLGENQPAGALFEEALPIERELYPHDLQLARTLAGMAAFKLQTGKTEEALPPAEEALDIALKTSGEDSVDAALAYATVAEIHRSSGRPERALPLYRKAQAIYERVLGPTHVRVASVLSQEGLVLMREGKLSLAEQDMQRSLDLLDISCPACTLERIIGESNLGLLRFKQRNYPEADRLLAHALSLQEQYSSQPTPDLAFMLKALAAVRQKEHLYDDAARLSQRASMIGAYR